VRGRAASPSSQHHPTRPYFILTLIFANTKLEVKYLVDFLESQNFPVAGIHGDMAQNNRNYALNGFKRGHVKALIATDVAARGIDIPNVAHVITYDTPPTLEHYVHRIGRTGRAGKKGKSTIFVDHQTAGPFLKQLHTFLLEHKQNIPDWFQSVLDSSRSLGSGFGNRRFGGNDRMRTNRFGSRSGGNGRNDRNDRNYRNDRNDRNGGGFRNGGNRFNRDRNGLDEPRSFGRDSRDLNELGGRILQNSPRNGGKPFNSEDRNSERYSKIDDFTNFRKNYGFDDTK